MSEERNWQKAVLEAALFQQREPASLPRLARLLQSTPDHVRQLLAEIEADLAHGSRGLELRRVQQKVQLAPKPECLAELKAAGGEFPMRSPLSPAALETLAVIAYFQPVTAAEIKKNRQVKGVDVLQTLLTRKLIRVVGRQKSPGHPLLYKTTDEFLIEFGFPSLDQLPPLEEFRAAKVASF